MKHYDFSLKNLKKAWSEDYSEAYCEAFFKRWNEMCYEGQNLRKNIDNYLETLDEDNFVIVFDPIIKSYEIWFNDDFPGRDNQNYLYITPIIIQAYDLVLSLRRSYAYRSAATSSLITRNLFEAMVNLSEIEKEPLTLSLQYSNYKSVALLWQDYREKLIDQKSLVDKMKSFPQWFHEDWKIMKKKKECWTGREIESLSLMADRNGYANEYNTIYRASSAFTHISPLVGNYYKNNGLGPISKTPGAFQMAYSGLSFAIDALAIATRIVGIRGSGVNNLLKVPFSIIMLDEEFFSKHSFNKP